MCFYHVCNLEHKKTNVGRMLEISVWQQIHYIFELLYELFFINNIVYFVFQFYFGKTNAVSHVRFNGGKSDYSHRNISEECKGSVEISLTEEGTWIKHNFRVNKIQVWSTWIFKRFINLKNVGVKWCVISNTIFYYGKQSLLNNKHVENGIEQLSFQVWKCNNFLFTANKKKDWSKHDAIYIEV